MNNYFGLLAKDLNKLWGSLGLGQKIGIVALFFATVGALAYFVAKSTEPNWGVLYSDLNETDAMAVIENLKKGGYPYKLSDDRKTILVPVKLKEELRIMVAENDVIKDSSPGFELLDKIQLGATDFQNKLTRQRIFQGELTRTIEKIRGVKKARIQLATPERSIFSQENDKPSASVMLILTAGYSLKPDQIRAIKNLVAYGIARLEPDRVFISDQNGIPLSEEVNSSSGDISDFRSSFEKQTAKKVTKVLERLVGRDNVSVEVSAEMNFNRERATIEKYIPASNEGPTSGVLISSQLETETYGNNQDATQDQQQNQNDQRRNYKKEKNIQNYNISKEIKQIVYAPGNIKRMTIAVALNRVLTSTEKEEIKNLIISASGADIERGDLITISGIQFAKDDRKIKAAKLIKEIEKDSKIEFWVRQVGPLAVVLFLGLAALFVLSSLLKRPLAGEEVYEAPTNEYYGTPSVEEEPEEEPELLENISIPTIEAKLDPELERMKSDLNNIIMTDPSEAARLLLSYIKD